MEEKTKQNNLVTRLVPPAQDTIRYICEPSSDVWDDHYRIPGKRSEEKVKQDCGNENEEDRQDNVYVFHDTKSHISIDRKNSISADRLTAKVFNLTNPHEIETEMGKAIGNITGGGDELRRLFELLQEKEEHFWVCKICEKRLEQENGGYLLLAPWFRSLVKYGVGLLEQNEESAKCCAAKFPIKDWDNELYEAYIEFLMAKLRDHQDVDSVLAELEGMAQKCRKKYPLAEIGYYGLAQVWLYLQKKPEAKVVLREVIFEKRLPLDPGQDPVYVQCPRCCLLLLSELEVKNYDDPKLIVWIAKKAVEYADGYDECDIGYVLFRLADAMERMKPRQTKKANVIYQQALEIIGDNKGEFGGKENGKDYPCKDYGGILKRRIKPFRDWYGKYTESMSGNKKILI